MDNKENIKSLYKNVTKYDSDLFLYANWAKTFNGRYSLLKMLMIIISIVVGSTICSALKNSAPGWIVLLLGVLILPTIFYVIPLSSNKRKYKKLLKKNNGREIIKEIYFHKKTIVVKDENCTEEYKYSDIIDILAYKKIRVIQFSNYKDIYLDIEGMKNGKIKDLDNFLIKTTRIDFKV